MPGGPDVVVFTKTLIERTGDRIENKAGDGSAEVTTDWSTYEKIYHPLEPKLQSGRGVWSRSKVADRKKGAPRDKLESLAWTGLISESEDRDTFSKKYALAYIRDTYLREVYHSRIFERGKRGGHVEEAAAQLYSVSRGENPLGGLNDFYEWKDDSFPAVEYKKAARLAFRYLKKAGYKESLWRKLEMSRGPEFDMTLLTVREQAETALTMLERDNKMRDHNKIEGKLGLSRNYAKLNRELERIILSAK